MSPCLLIENLSTHCTKCSKALCLRQQVLCLALGEDENLLCLTCLAAENAKSEGELLAGLKDYIAGRDCFKKEWIRYENVSFCPQPGTCLPEICFAQGSVQ
jgi:hypothetical protein